ncbi:MAG: hypothetical protein A3J87_03990 [Sideroxydans sp. RIFOXYB12_FULL_59_6]|nr:MAG: hypothetical protein A3J87_03990 [Sideroxydans sp. RIFOXYB12_FULL_59_6]
MVVIAYQSRLIRHLGTGELVIVVMVIAMIVGVMTEMFSMARRMFQCITNPHGCHISGIQ